MASITHEDEPDTVEDEITDKVTGTIDEGNTNALQNILLSLVQEKAIR